MGTFFWGVRFEGRSEGFCRVFFWGSRIEFLVMEVFFQKKWVKTRWKKKRGKVVFFG